jgi:conjugative transfer signal peptidase TraF
MFLVVIQLATNVTGRRYVLNLSKSEPRGIYFVEPLNGILKRGDLIFMQCPPGFEKYLYGRKWLPEGWPLLKTVRGIPGDQYCISENGISVNGKKIGPVYSVDSQGLPLPASRGCRTVPEKHFLPVSIGLLNSFDGRYFGVVSDSLIIGKARPVLKF